jgi:hypothetical protein
MRRALALCVLLAAGRAHAQAIVVTSATYGYNVPGVTPGNATSQVAGQCNGLYACAYTVWYYNFTPDPAPGKAKQFIVNWTCGGTPYQTTATPLYQGNEAGYGSIATLSCPTVTPTPTPTRTPTPTPTPGGGPQILKWRITYQCTPPYKSCTGAAWTNVINYQITNPDYPGVTAVLEIIP